jgi:hypothetical protein
LRAARKKNGVSVIGIYLETQHLCIEAPLGIEIPNDQDDGVQSLDLRHDAQAPNHAVATRAN